MVFTPLVYLGTGIALGGGILFLIVKLWPALMIAGGVFIAIHGLGKNRDEELQENEES